jgi:hypothetical protein
MMPLANETSSVSGENVSEGKSQVSRFETLACEFSAAPGLSFFQVALLVGTIIDVKMGEGPKLEVSRQDLR